MLSDKEILQVEKELTDKIEKLMLLQSKGEKIGSDFLLVKIGFTSFIGVIFTIVFASQDKFSVHFLEILSAITLLAFALLLFEFWTDLFDFRKAWQSQSLRVTLAQIRHIASIQKDHEKFRHYGQQAEKRLHEDNKILTLMEKGVPFEKIVGADEPSGWYWNSIAWTILILSIPLLMLTKVFGYV